MDQETIGADARLSRVSKFRRHRGIHGLIDVGVVEDYERSVPAQFQRHFFDGIAPLLHEKFSHGRGTREAYLFYGRVGAEFFTDVRGRFPVGGHKLENTVGHTRSIRQRLDRQRRQRCQFARFHHGRASRRQRRSDLSRNHRYRKIPRRDHRRHSDRLLHGHDLSPRRSVGCDERGGRDASSPRRRRTDRLRGVIIQKGTSVRYLSSRFAEGLAGFERHDPRDVLGILLDEGRPAGEDRRSMSARGAVAPGREGRGRFVDRLLRVVPSHSHHPRDDVVPLLDTLRRRGWIGHGERLLFSVFVVSPARRREEGRILERTSEGQMR
mmetsp:Transcript_10543/g.31058  ORF Transcript_10543/g.31058 Transcript_10543/m.31058 type:complete len:324 (+) Transcript_10543:743-1714(+)